MLLFIYVLHVFRYVFIKIMSTNQIILTMFVQVTKKLKLKIAALILEFGTAKPSGALPAGSTVKASTNIPAGEMGLVKSVGCEHGDRMDQFVAAPTTPPVTQIGLLFSNMAQKEG
jgi:hypothetical protein